MLGPVGITARTASSVCEKSTVLGRSYALCQLTAARCMLTAMA